MKINEAKELSNKILAKLGFRTGEAELITQNLIEAELVEKKTHGFVRLPAITRLTGNGSIKVINEDIEVISEHPASILKRKKSLEADEINISEKLMGELEKLV